MEKISPLTFPDKDSKRQALLELAGNERESMQIVISNSTPDKLYGINCHVNDFIDAEGRKFPGKIEFRRIAYLPRTIPYGTHPEQLPEHEYWLPRPASADAGSYDSGTGKLRYLDDGLRSAGNAARYL